MKTSRYATLKTREAKSVKISRFSSEEVRDANREFKKGMVSYFRESDRKIARSARKARNTIVR